MWRQNRSLLVSISSQFGQSSRRYLPSKNATRCCAAATKPTSSRPRDPRIEARPPGDKELTESSKFPLPDKDKELELSKLQNAVQDYYKAGNYRKALQVSESLLTATKKHFNEQHPATASAHNNLGLMHKQLGNFDESRQHYRAALKLYQVAVGTDHASYASALHNLGTLNRTQIHFDSSLKATDRLSLVEQSLQYLEHAYEIRQNELGQEHPHTVASRSGWGATLATQILHHYKMSSSQKQKVYLSLLPVQMSDQAWEVAEEHLRQALQTAIANPRGPSLTRNKKKGKAQQPSDDTAMQTVSAASAGQNLAIFLKARASTQSPPNHQGLEEARNLYHQVLQVRSKLLPAEHPDLFATKHSLAECLEAMGDEEAANAMRQEIVDAYHPDDAEKSDGDGNDTHT